MTWERFPVPHGQSEGTIVEVDGQRWMVTHHDWFSTRDGHLMCGCGWSLLDSDDD